MQPKSRTWYLDLVKRTAAAALDPAVQENRFYQIHPRELGRIPHRTMREYLDDHYRNTPLPDHASGKPEYITDIAEILSTIVGSGGKTLDHHAFTTACELLVDRVVMGALIQGFHPQMLDDTAFFLAQLRKELGKSTGQMEILSAMAKNEEKLALGREAYQVIRTQIEKQYHCPDLYTLSLHQIMRAEHPDDPHAMPDDATYERAETMAATAYHAMLARFGLENNTPQYSLYTMALFSRALAVANAELGHTRDSGKERVSYGLSRSMALLEEAMSRYPLLTQEEMQRPDVTLDPRNIYTYPKDPLLGAATWLDQQRTKVTKLPRYR